MTKHTNHPDQQHIDAVLEPIAPASGYDFVEIESNPIAWRSPIAKLPSFIRSAFKLGRWCIQSQWKVALVLVLCVLGSEFALRSFEPRLMGRIYSRSQTGGHPISFNTQGFRGDLVTLEKPENTLRILAMGDSVTFGTGIDWHNTWSNQLAQIINEHPDQSSHHRAEVINAGLPALDLGHIEYQLTNQWAQYHPDQVVLVLSGNMISFGYARRDRTEISLPNPARLKHIENEPALTPKDQLTKVYAAFALPGAITIGMDHLKLLIGLEDHASDPAFPTGVMLAHGYQQNEIDTETIEQAWEIFADQMASLALAADSMGVELTVVYSPPRFMLSEKRTDNLKWVNLDRLTIDPVDRSAQICRDLNIEFIDPRSALIEAPHPVYMLSDYTHYDVSGHHTIASLIADSIKARSTNTH